MLPAAGQGGTQWRVDKTTLVAWGGHQSEAKAGIVRDMMMAKAGAGQWNGSASPSGHRTKFALVLRREEKKILVINDEVDCARAMVPTFAPEWCTDQNKTTNSCLIETAR